MNYSIRYVYTCVLLWCTMSVCHAQTLEVPGFEMASGQTRSLVVNLKDNKTIDTYNTLSLSMLIPNGFNVGNQALQLSDKWGDPLYALGDIDQNRNIRMAIASATELPGQGVDELITLNLKADENTTPDVYFIKLKNILLEYATKGKDRPDDVTMHINLYKLGDDDKNGMVLADDATRVINYILTGQADDGINIMLADMNDDKDIDVFDVMKMITYILKAKLPHNVLAQTRTTDSLAYENLSLYCYHEGITISIPAPQRFTSFQFDIELSDDIEMNGVSLLNSSTGHLIQFSRNEDNSYRVVGLSLENSQLASTTDNKLIGLDIPHIQKIAIKNAMFVTQQGKITYFNNKEMEIAPDNDSSQQESIYDISGRKMPTDRRKLHKGVYIINNKKVVIK